MSSNCPCDVLVFPPGLAIAPSLTTLARQIAQYPEYRQALLLAIPTYVPLSEWRARDNFDFGLMLLEMWAVLADMVSFYDEVIAQELYLRTANRRPSLRKLTGLLGYIPRPASSSAVTLAGIADGRVLVNVPQQTAFRSGAFPGSASQVFETAAQSSIHPAFNSWRLKTVKSSVFASTAATQHFLLATAGTAAVKKDDVVLFVAFRFARVLQVQSVEAYAGVDGESYSKITFTTAIGVPAGTAVASARLFKPGAKAGLWKKGSLSPYATVSHRTRLRLESLVRQITATEYILVGRGTDLRWFTVRNVVESDTTIVDSTTTNITDAAGAIINRVVTPAVTVPVTRLYLNTIVTSPDRGIPGQPYSWTTADKDVSVHYSMINSAQITVEGKPSIAPTDPLQVDHRPSLPPGATPPGQFLLQDADGRGVSISGSLNFTTGRLSIAQGSAWTGSLAAPVTVYGNLLTANRGETVRPEFLGTGDASQSRQTFKLKKNPLSYVPSATAGNVTGVASTLTIYVDGVRWTEVPGFFGLSAGAQVFIVRQDDSGNSLVTLNRLRTGAPVVAYYRYGAGQASPPAGSISQVARPVPGLRSVRNPVAAAAGSDAEESAGIRAYAPRSALLLGRAISVPDLQAAAAIQPGVRAASAEWAWNDDAQMPVIQVYYIGAQTLESQIAHTLRNLTDGVTPIRVNAATALVREISFDIMIDDRYLSDAVLAGIRAALAAPKQGILVPEQLGINRPLFRSAIFETVLAVPGALAVRGLSLRGLTVFRYGIQPGAGKYFNFETGGVVLNGHRE
jgi:hypothetical protein